MIIIVIIKKYREAKIKPPNECFSSPHLGPETEETAYNHLQLQKEAEKERE